VIGVGKVAVPDWLDRPQVTGRAMSGEVVTDEFSRWGEPVPRGIQRVLAENLTRLMPERRLVVAPYPPRDAVDHFVELRVVEAARQTDGSVLLESRWEVLDRAGKVLARRHTAHRARPTALGAAGAVAGLNDALGALSREIAGVLGELPPPAKQTP
jgi:uncharacterized lipoprotein YmbA